MSKQVERQTRICSHAPRVQPGQVCTAFHDFPAFKRAETRSRLGDAGRRGATDHMADHMGSDRASLAKHFDETNTIMRILNPNYDPTALPPAK